MVKVELLKGIYVLIIRVAEDIKVEVGALGEKAFKEGLYAYVGSAQANLEQRVNRHLRKVKRKFWHIDYLLDNPAAKIVTVFYREAEKDEECKTAKHIGERGTPVSDFGCSDCHCTSHLFHLDDYDFLLDSMQELSEFS